MYHTATIIFPTIPSSFDTHLRPATTTLPPCALLVTPVIRRMCIVLTAPISEFHRPSVAPAPLLFPSLLQHLP